MRCCGYTGRITGKRRPSRVLLRGRILRALFLAQRMRKRTHFHRWREEGAQQSSENRRSQLRSPGFGVSTKKPSAPLQGRRRPKMVPGVAQLEKCASTVFGKLVYRVFNPGHGDDHDSPAQFPTLRNRRRRPGAVGCPTESSATSLPGSHERETKKARKSTEVEGHRTGTAASDKIIIDLRRNIGTGRARTAIRLSLTKNST